jgi:hypothetical protein
MREVPFLRVIAVAAVVEVVLLKVQNLVFGH